MPKYLSLAVRVAAVALMASGCATTTVPFRHAPAQPAATGEMKIRPEPNGNAYVKLRVEHLATPSRLTPPRTTYVVWAQHRDGKSALLGRLAPNKELKASWQGTVPFDSFRLLITAEDFAAPLEPGTPEILVTEFVQVGPKRWYQF
jgi:hypothetical protein